MGIGMKDIPYMKRSRKLVDYVDLLGLEKAEYDRIAPFAPDDPFRIMLIGGGASPIQKELGTRARVTNVDMFPPSAELGDKASPGDVAAENSFVDFIDYVVSTDAYDEVWALFSLPFYADSPIAIATAMAKAALAAKPGGIVRMSPISDFCAVSPAAQTMGEGRRIAAIDRTIRDLGKMASGAIKVQVLHQAPDPIMLADTPEELFTGRHADRALYPCRVKGADMGLENSGAACEHLYRAGKDSLIAEMAKYGAVKIEPHQDYETIIMRMPENEGIKSEINRALVEYINFRRAHDAAENEPSKYAACAARRAPPKGYAANSR
jgi:hypothetical protein